MIQPTLLALDTATDTLHLALLAGGVVRTVRAEGGAKASAALVPALQALLVEAGIGWADLDAIAFGRGPGAFTGLRTAAAVTQGLALGSGKPVMALDTLLAVAEDARQATLQSNPSANDPRLFWAATDARMGEVYAAAYQHQAGRWTTIAEPALMAPQDFVARAQALSTDRPHGPHGIVAGNALQAHAGALHDLPVCLTRCPHAAPSGHALIALAQSAWERGATLDAALALPLYVRDKVAQTTAERQALADAKRAEPAAAPA